MKIHSYSWVRKLRKKYYNDQEITVPEIRKLEKYVRRKRKVAKFGDVWSQKQLLKAERLLEILKEENGMMTKEVEKPNA